MERRSAICWDIPVCILLAIPEALGERSTARVRLGKIILGELGGIETGVRQLLRSRPLETTEIDVQGKRLVIPTAAGVASPPRFGAIPEVPPRARPRPWRPGASTTASMR
jgi:hypothetical protein